MRLAIAFALLLIIAGVGLFAVERIVQPEIVVVREQVSLTPIPR